MFYSFAHLLLCLTHNRCSKVVELTASTEAIFEFSSSHIMYMYFTHNTSHYSKRSEKLPDVTRWEGHSHRSIPAENVQLDWNHGETSDRPNGGSPSNYWPALINSGNAIKDTERKTQSWILDHGRNTAGDIIEKIRICTIPRVILYQNFWNLKMVLRLWTRMFLFLGNAAKYLGIKGQVVYNSQMVQEKKWWCKHGRC